jgi:hypothetical protein
LTFARALLASQVPLSHPTSLPPPCIRRRVVSFVVVMFWAGCRRGLPQPVDPPKASPSPAVAAAAARAVCGGGVVVAVWLVPSLVVICCVVPTVSNSLLFQATGGSVLHLMIRVSHDNSVSTPILVVQPITVDNPLRRPVQFKGPPLCVELFIACCDVSHVLYFVPYC